MGSYCTLYVAGQSIGSTKNGIDPSQVLLFRASDREEEVLVPGTPEYLEYFAMPGPGENWEPVEHRRVVYRTDCETVKERLDVLGFTLETASRALELAVARERMELRKILDSTNADYLAERVSVFESLTVQAWLRAARTIHENRLDELDSRSAEFESLPPLLRALLGGVHDDWMGCPVRDSRHVIRLFLEVVPPQETVELDLTDLVAGGWIDSESDAIEEAEALLMGEAAVADRVVVLTEGASDKRVLERALALLTPSIADYFRFLDFEGARVAGGAGALAQIVKAFVGAGISNRTIAVFDNDTAAAEALEALNKIDLPPHFAVIAYPPLPCLVNYPTLGPTGLTPLDVNGLAASLELYLGEDVLRRPDGTLTPVQWRGYSERVRRYQGVVTEKAEILARFESKLQRAEANAADFVSGDWTGLRAIIRSLSQAAAATSSQELLVFEGREL